MENNGNKELLSYEFIYDHCTYNAYQNSFTAKQWICQGKSIMPYMSHGAVWQPAIVHTTRHSIVLIVVPQPTVITVGNRGVTRYEKTHYFPLFYEYKRKFAILFLFFG